MMLNQIAAFHRRRPAEEAAAEIATHVERFWDPRMRQSIYARLNDPDLGLTQTAHAAMQQLQHRDAAKPHFDPAETPELPAPLEA
jgi:formate dehydrogenase subunit delta